jgi:hypothetical protein
MFNTGTCARRFSAGRCRFNYFDLADRDGNGAPIVIDNLATPARLDHDRDAWLGPRPIVYKHITVAEISP